MWKKFCLAILSICLLSGATYLGGLLSAAEASTLQFTAQQSGEHYVGNAFSYALSGSRGEEVVDISGGEIHGNGMMYQIPFDEDAILRFADMSAPGFYQGEISAEIRDGSDGTLQEIKGTIAFTLYGIVYRFSQYEMIENEQMELETYGALPEQLHDPLFTYSSDAPDVVSVDEDGKVTALKAGSCTIRMVVYDGVRDEAHQLYESNTEVIVSKANTKEFKETDALDGTANGYRFIQSQQVTAQEEKAQKIGMFDLAQSGEYTYQIEKTKQQEYEVRDGELYLLKAQKAGSYTVSVYIIPKDREHFYVVKCTYTVDEAEKEVNEEAFRFRYDGKDTNGIIRQYQEGKNTFQLTSNKNLDEVRFSLKEENDDVYMSVSQTGNVKVKQITEKPVTIIAKWHNEVYELNVIIEKADQVLTCAHEDISISLEDGAFDPLLNGRLGKGSLIGTIKDQSDVVELRYNDSGNLSILPLKAGDAHIEVYNDGDDNYKKSNVLTLHIHVLDQQVISDEWIGDTKWLNVQGEMGENGWYVSPIRLSLRQSVDVQAFQYQDHEYEELLWNENGDALLPLKFVMEDHTVSTPAKLSLQVDTHTPMITAITERPAADSDWKKWIDEITFQQAFGQGMIIDIDASDTLMNAQIPTSGISEIAYRIYRVEDGQEMLLKEGIQTDKEQISVEVEDRGTHKVCASAKDNAGLKSAEICQIMSDVAPKTITAENSGMVLYSNDLSTSSQFLLQEVTEEELQNAADQLQVHGETQTIIGYHMDWDKQLEQDVQDIQAVIPMTAKFNDHITWYQKQEDGSLAAVTSEMANDAYILDLHSLRDIYCVKNDEDSETRQNYADLHLPTNKQTVFDPMQSNTEVTKVALRPLNLASEDMQMLMIAAGSMIVLCFIILLIRSGREEY